MDSSLFFFSACRACNPRTSRACMRNEARKDARRANFQKCTQNRPRKAFSGITCSDKADPALFKLKNADFP